MFSNLLSSLQLADAEESNGQDAAAGNSSAGQATDSSNKGTHVSFWGVAAAVAGTVRATADDFVNTVKQTDWQSELKNFGKEVAQDTKSLSNNAATLVDQLPLHLDAAGDEVYAGEGSEHFRSVSPNQESEDAVAAKLEEVGSAIATFGRSLMAGTQELVEQVREAVETEIVAVVKDQKPGQRSRGVGSSASNSRLATTPAGKYNRFEAEVTAMQRDSSTYCDEPEDKEDFAAWKACFQLASMKSDIDKIVRQNAFMAELQSRIVPLIVEYEDFWTRYFYRLHKLQLKEAQRQELHSRMSKADDVEMSWDDDDAIPSTRPALDKPTPDADTPPITTAKPARATATPAQTSPAPQPTSSAHNAAAAVAYEPDVPAQTDTPVTAIATAAPPAVAASSAEGSLKSATLEADRDTPTPSYLNATSSSEGTPAPRVATVTTPADKLVPHEDVTTAGDQTPAAPVPVLADVAGSQSSVGKLEVVAAVAAESASGVQVVKSAQDADSTAVGEEVVVTPVGQSGHTTPAEASGVEGLASKAAVAVERDGSTPDTASDITSPEWCVISNASASDAGVNSIDTRADRDPQATNGLSESKDDDEDDEELAVNAGDGAPGEDDDEEVDEDWGNWG